MGCMIFGVHHPQKFNMGIPKFSFDLWFGHLGGQKVGVFPKRVPVFRFNLKQSHEFLNRWDHGPISQFRSTI